MPDELAQPHGASLTDHENAQPDALLEIQDRVDQLAAKLEVEGLGWESDYKQKLLAEIEQRMRLREAVLVGAAFVAVAMLMFAWTAFGKLLDTDGPSVIGIGAKVGLFVTPIISATTITIMMLIGPFKRSKDEDQDKVSLPSLMLEAYKSTRS